MQMTQREEFENKITAIDELFGITRNLKHDVDTDNYFDAPTNSAYMWFKLGWQAAKAQAVPEGWKLVPIEPAVEQFGGMARDIIQWMRFTPSSDQHSQSLIEWLKNMGNEIPSWLIGENEINHLSRHVISKGSIAAIIYKAMLEAAPEQNK